MRFGTCSGCKEYKYLEDEGLCPTCNENEWGIAVHHSYSGPSQIIESGLSEKEAKERVKHERWLTAVKIR